MFSFVIVAAIMVLYNKQAAAIEVTMFIFLLLMSNIPAVML